MFRRTCNLGARRIQSELRRHFDISLALATIHKVLSKHGVEPLVQHRQKSGFVRYERPVPSDRIQMDTCKIGQNLYQYTTIDDCTRYRVLRLYGPNTLDFLEAVLEEMPFPMQRIQTDRGREFFALKVQKILIEVGIKFRPNKPVPLHLNGKVERSQKTDKLEFYATVDTQSEVIHDQLAEWQHYYNWDRLHSAHGGKSPMEHFLN